MAEQLNILPTSLMAGESINETIIGLTLSGSVVYSFNSKVPVSVTCTEDETDFLLEVSGAETLTFKYGTLKYSAIQTIDGVSVCVDYGQITVAASPAATSNYTAALAAVEAAILAYGSSANKRIKVDTIEIEYRDLSDLLSLKNYYSNLIAIDTGNPGAGGLFNIYSRFT